MKKKILYTCETCHTDYKYKEEAEKCEKSHVVDLEIAEAKYYPYKMCGAYDGFPAKIVLKDKKTGEMVTYKR